MVSMVGKAFMMIVAVSVKMMMIVARMLIFLMLHTLPMIHNLIFLR